MQEQNAGMAEMASNLQKALTTVRPCKQCGSHERSRNRACTPCKKSNERARYMTVHGKAMSVLRSRKYRENQVAKDWSKREYKPRVVNENAEMEFAIEFPKTPNPWGQSEELDDLIKHGQSDSPGIDRTFLGVRVERCTRGLCIQMLAPEDASTEVVELVANTLHPSYVGKWVWDKYAVIEHVEGGWLVTLRYSSILSRGGNDVED